MLPWKNSRRRRVTSLVALLCCVVWGIVYQSTQLKPFVVLTLTTMTTTFPAFVRFDGSLWNHQNDHNNATTTNQPDQELLLYEAVQRLTSQDVPRRNNSRQLCGVIPNSSPPAVHFPNILHSSPPQQPSKQMVCRPNAILYMVQKGKHSSYDRNSTALFLKSLDLLYHNYLSLDHHADNVDVLIFHSGDYTQQDLDFLAHRYNHTVHFKLIDLSESDYWKIPTAVQHDNVSQWAVYSEFSVGYRHMIRWYALRLYDFIRDFAAREDGGAGGGGGCRYQYLWRMDEDSFLHSPIRYDLFQFMQQHNYSYGFRMCAYEMETDVWEDYVDHAQFCGTSLLPAGMPIRTVETGLCGFYNNFFVVEVDFVLQPHVQQFLQWTDATGIMYRERYNDLQIQTIAVYAFLPPERIHRFLDWTYEHMTYAMSNMGMMCPHWGAIQAGYLDRHVDPTLLRFTIESRMNRRKCPAIRKHKVFREEDMSPTYAHLPPESWWNATLGISRRAFEWKTIAAGSVESPYKGNLSG